MDAHEKYFFDVNGYLIVEDILSPEQVHALNQAIDNNQDKIRLREGELSLSHGSPALEGTHGRGDIGGILNWPKPWCQPFRDLISHPPALRYMLELIGNGFRHGNANGISMTTGAEGCILHGGGMDSNQHRYRYENGTMWNNLMGVCYQLADINPGDGGFVCIPGSHKANLGCPEDGLRMECDIGCFKHLPMKAGSALVFTEAMTHGTLPWNGQEERRSVLYKYASRAAARAVGKHFTPRERYGDWTDELTPEQQAVLYGPGVHHGGRLPLLESDGQTVRVANA